MLVWPTRRMRRCQGASLSAANRLVASDAAGRTRKSRRSMGTTLSGGAELRRDIIAGSRGGSRVSRLPLLVLFAATLPAETARPFRPEIPKMWVDSEMEALELTLPRPEYTLKFIPAADYYRIPVRPVYKTYPVYALDREPAGYLEKLRQSEPEIVFDPA